MHRLLNHQLWLLHLFSRCLEVSSLAEHWPQRLEHQPIQQRYHLLCQEYQACSQSAPALQCVDAADRVGIEKRCDIVEANAKLTELASASFAATASEVCR